MDFVMEHWYVPQRLRNEWRRKYVGKMNQAEIKNFTETHLSNLLHKIEVDNTIHPNGCTFGGAGNNNGGNDTLKVIGWNAERGTYYSKLYQMIQDPDKHPNHLSNPDVILLNEMDIGMARSGNVHTTRRLAMKLGYNYAFGVEFLELTKGTEEEHNTTEGKRNALGLHGNAILTKCILKDPYIIRDDLSPKYFSNKPEKGVNANGYEIRLGGRMGLFARIYEKDPNMKMERRDDSDNSDGSSGHNSGSGIMTGEIGRRRRLRSSHAVPPSSVPSPSTQSYFDTTTTTTADTNNTVDEYYEHLNSLPSHYVVGNVHKLGTSIENRYKLWQYYGFGIPPEWKNYTTTNSGGGVGIRNNNNNIDDKKMMKILNDQRYTGFGIDLPTNQKGVIMQGDFSPKFCPLGGLIKLNEPRHKTFRVKCLPGEGNVRIRPLSADYFCTNMKMYANPSTSTNNTKPAEVHVTPSCDWNPPTITTTTRDTKVDTKKSTNPPEPITLSDHAIVSVVVQSNK